MVRMSLIHVIGNHVTDTGNHVTDHFFSIPIGIGLFIVVSAVVALCANHVRRPSKKEGSNHSSIGNTKTLYTVEEDHNQDYKIPPRSPLRSPKQLITTISNKAINSFAINHKRGGGQDGNGVDKVVEEGFGQGGVWQKEILMGVKCQPPEFSGVIYYDYDGRQVSEFPPRSPRSPRIAPSSDFTFPMIKSYPLK